MRLLAAIGFAVLAAAAAQETEYRCPMDAEVRTALPGSCPRCGMQLVRRPMNLTEYRLDMRANHSPRLRLQFTVTDPRNGRRVRRFQPLHERLFHLFVVNQDLEYFAHEHPTLDAGDRFQVDLTPTAGGLHRVLADFCPEGGEPQTIVKSIVLPGAQAAAKLSRDDLPKDGPNLHVTIDPVPPDPRPGVKTMLFFRVSPAEGFEQYLGAWGHLFAASDDLIDVIHSHPVAANGTEIQFNLIFPRPRIYRIWVQFQRSGVVNTTRFDLPVRPLQ